MIGLSRGQRLAWNFKVGNKAGFGTLYVLDSGIVFEASGKGTCLELGHDEISRVKETKKEKFSISWYEGEVQHHASFKAKNTKEIVEKLTTAKNKKPNLAEAPSIRSSTEKSLP